LFQDTDIVELELKSKKFSLALRKKEALESAEPQVVYQVRGPNVKRVRGWCLTRDAASSSLFFQECATRYL
jgi:hypothetical protein